MTREQLEKYHDITVRLKLLASTVVVDAVVGSSDEYPYTTHPVTLRGVRSDTKTLSEVESLELQKNAIDEYIDGIVDVRLKTIFELHIKHNLSWIQVGKHLGMPPDAARMRYARNFQK